MIETNSRTIIERLKEDGYELVNVRGSHHKYRKNARTVIVPHPENGLPPGTARGIAKQAGWL